MRVGSLISIIACRFVVFVVFVVFLAMLPSAAFAQNSDGWNTVVGGSSVALSFSVQGDNLFFAKCSNSGNLSARGEVSIEAFLINSPGFATSSAIRVKFVADSTPMLLDGIVRETDGNNARAALSAKFDAPFFLALATANSLQIGIPAQGNTNIDLASGRNEILVFLRTCDDMLRVAGQSTTQQPAAAAPSTSPPATSDDDDLSIAEGVALGILALGAAIIADEIANEINEQVFTEEPAPTAPTNGQGRMINVQISSVKAIETTFGFGGDEVFLLASNGARYPSGSGNAHSIGAGQTWSPNVQVSVPGGVSFDLREWDTFDASDLIGNFTIDSNHATGQFTTTLRGDGAVYEIAYSVGFSGQTPVRVTPRPAQPRTPRRTWSNAGFGGSVTALDCTNCEEDIGILFMCQGLGLAAVVDVPWAATEFGRAGSVRPLTITIGRRTFSYDATVQGPGLVGYTPSFKVNPNDPLIAALQSGRSARIDFGGKSTTLGLRGSRIALDTFQQQCGWNNILATTPPQPEENPELWFTDQFNDSDSGQAASSLTFGIPETDAVGFSALCLPGDETHTVEVDMLVDFGPFAPGTTVNVYIQARGETYQFQGQVFQDNDEWAGVRVTIDTNDAVWRAMASAQQPIAYGVYGGGKNISSVRSAATAIRQFQNSCNTPAPVRPAVTPSGQTTYMCDDGSTLSVAISPAGATAVANVTQANGAQVALIQVPTQVGSKFSNGVATLNLNGPTVQFMGPNAALFCQAS